MSNIFVFENKTACIHIVSVMQNVIKMNESSNLQGASCDVIVFDILECFYKNF